MPLGAPTPAPASTVAPSSTPTWAGSAATPTNGRGRRAGWPGSSRPTAKWRTCASVCQLTASAAEYGRRPLRGLLLDSRPSRQAWRTGSPALSAGRSLLFLSGPARTPAPGLGQGWLLVGDAGYWKDPLSVHGMTDALRDAELAADAIQQLHGGADEATAYSAYQARRDRRRSSRRTDPHGRLRLGYPGHPGPAA